MARPPLRPIAGDWREVPCEAAASRAASSARPTENAARLKKSLEAPPIARRRQRPVDLFRPIGRPKMRSRSRRPLLSPAHERIRDYRIKNRVDTVRLDVINDHCQFRLSFRCFAVEYWFEKRTGVCGASRSSSLRIGRKRLESQASCRKRAGRLVCASHQWHLRNRTLREISP
jgi:hypothetical protein